MKKAIFLDSKYNDYLRLSPDIHVELNLVDKKIRSSLNHEYFDFDSKDFDDLAEILRLQNIENKSCKIMPTNLSVTLDNKCNVACSIAKPSRCDQKHLHISKDIYDDFMSISDLSFKASESIDEDRKSFFKYLEKISLGLCTLRILGGEPFLQKSLIDFIHFFEENECPYLDLHIHSPLAIEYDELMPILERLNDLVKSKKIKKVFIEKMTMTLNPEYANKLSPGSDFNLAIKNVKRILEEFDCINVITFLYFTVFDIDMLFEYRKYYRSFEPKFNRRLGVLFDFVTYPKSISIEILPVKILKDLQRKVKDFRKEFLHELKDYYFYMNPIEAFIDNELERRLTNDQKNIHSPNINEFYVFLSEAYSKDEIEEFPREVKEYFRYCESMFYDPEISSRDFRFKKIKNDLGLFSDSMCFAKWFHATLHLHMGQTHSCHHPNPHDVSVQEVINNYKAIHNSSYKKEQRKKMLRGERPEECSYCWRVEDSNSDVFSDRFLKSSEQWAGPFKEELLDNPGEVDINPRYLELSFSSNCNLKCTYCHPMISKAIRREYEKFGKWSYEEYNLLEVPEIQQMLKYDKEGNPFVEAFWKWFPELYQGLKVLRLTGGEPFMSKDTATLLKYVQKHKNKDLELSINSNLCFDQKLVIESCKEVIKAVETNNLKELVIWASIDAHGKRAEYIRHGLDYNRFFKNVEFLLQNNIRVQFMVTFNLLSVTSFEDLLKDTVELKKKYPRKLVVSCSYLHQPERQSVFILPENYHKFLDHSISYMESEPEHFDPFEVHSFQRIVNVIKSSERPKNIQKLRAEFFQHFYENDERRGTSFPDTFPEMGDFWNLCIEAYEKLKIIEPTSR